MFQKRSRLKNLLHFKALLSYALAGWFAHGKSSTVCFGVVAVFLARKVSKGKIAFDAGNLAEVSPILEELSSALIPLAQHIADELMREDAGLNEKNHWLIFHANIRSRFDLSPYNSRENSCKMVSIREIFTHSGFPWLFRFPGPFFLLSTIENLSRMFFFCRLFLLQKWKRFGGDRKSGSRTLRTIH